MKITNKYGLPGPLVRAVTNDPYKQVGDISVTRLIQPPRIVQLKKRHAKEIVVDVSERLFILDGQADHHHLERAGGDNALMEERLSMNVGGWQLTGQFDYYEDGVLSDYKRTSIWAVLNGVKPEWEAQLNILAFLVREAGFEVNRLQIVALLRDWSKNRARRESDFPPAPVKVLRVRLWDKSEARDMIADLIRNHQACEDLTDDQLPLCSDEDRWIRSSYALFGRTKSGSWTKRARKVEASKAELFAYCDRKGIMVDDNTWKIEHRRGEPIRCLDYCEVAPFCNQYQGKD